MIGLLVLIVIVVLIGGGMWVWPFLAGILGLSSVTDKPGALQHIRQLMVTYDISPSEVEATYLAPAVSGAATTQRSKSDIAKTLFVYLGAIFILAGVGTYIGMFWGSMGSAMRIFVTLGIGYILLLVLISALHENKYLRAVWPLTFAMVFMMVSGWFVLIDELIRTNNWRNVLLFVTGTMAVHLGLLFRKYRRTLFAVLGLIFVYGFMQVGLDKLGMSYTHIAIVLGASLFLVGSTLEKTPQPVLAELAILIGSFWLNGGLFDVIAKATAPNWASLIIGVSLVLTAYGLQTADKYPRLIALGYLVGSAMLYAGLFDLVQGTSIELLFLAVTAGILYACVVLQSRAMLLTTVLAMLSFIGYFSAKHFVDSLGWPITLVITGVIFLGIGMIAIRVKRAI
ncbi:MAG: hypothetical protein ACR2QT_08155 [Woeseiaceae bacterium]